MSKVIKLKMSSGEDWWQRTIKINGVSTKVSHPDKKYLKELPYRLESKTRIKKEEELKNE